MRLNSYDILTKKKNGQELSKEEIEFMVYGYTKGEVMDYQMSALLMAICINGMTNEETYNLTIAMRDSGDVLDLSKINGIKVDKHSTGGVGDKISLILSPMVATLGVHVAKMSGRGLGHTGGTIDKLESIPGFKTSMEEEKFIENVNSIGIAIAGQTANLAPADKKIYALRDVTATVDCIPLIASSIMSKKLASGADAIVLDVKCGNGAFMKNEILAKKLAKTMVDIGKSANKKMAAVITDMNQPLGTHIGNALEIIEVIETLKGRGQKDILEVVYSLGEKMLVFAGVAQNDESARTMLKKTIQDGSALEKFAQFIRTQGGDDLVINNYDILNKARYVFDIKANKNGYICNVDTEEIGKAVCYLGGGRKTKTDIIDPYVGIVMHKKLGDRVEENTSIFTVYANDEMKYNSICNQLMDSVKITEFKENFIIPQIVKQVI